MATLREGVKGKGECENMQELTAWIERCFSLKYEVGPELLHEM